jgi:hypothetical protein
LIEQLLSPFFGEKLFYDYMSSGFPTEIQKAGALTTEPRHISKVNADISSVPAFSDLADFF